MGPSKACFMEARGKEGTSSPLEGSAVGGVESQSVGLEALS